VVVGAVSVSAKGAERVTLVCSEEMQIWKICSSDPRRQPYRHTRDYCYGSLPIVVSIFSMPLPPPFTNPCSYRQQQTPKPSYLLLPLDIINRQIHTHPPRRQPDPLLLIHIHPRIIPFHKSDIHPLRLQIDSQLLRLVHFLPKRFCSADAVETGR